MKNQMNNTTNCNELTVPYNHNFLNYVVYNNRLWFKLSSISKLFGIKLSKSKLASLNSSSSITTISLESGISVYVSSLWVIQHISKKFKDDFLAVKNSIGITQNPARK
ncbi:MAG: hypothetical protein F6K48_14545 [Okeania sp. SIO3H1]|uniref:hypothetical protein n=1 Tax=Okeania sp. SIO1I7 TaxID=2607772 RepID=UPI0013CA17F1|nr:hypothetical protein [Okeania sp. SIO1I7]NEN90061.1 hypothetical protein [Okeania sp. SIO3H1]NET25399.1 hypothetical protein [Okeania sp. SIO1I7]